MFFKPLYIYKMPLVDCPKQYGYCLAIMFVNRSGRWFWLFLTFIFYSKSHFSVADAGIVMAFYGTGALFSSGTF